MKVSVDKMKSVLKSFRKDIQQQVEAIECERGELRHELHKGVWNIISNDFDPTALIRSVEYDTDSKQIAVYFGGASTIEMLYNDVVDGIGKIGKLREMQDDVRWRDYKVERMLYQIDRMVLDNEVDLRLVVRYGEDMGWQGMVREILMSFTEGQEYVATSNI